MNTVHPRSTQTISDFVGQHSLLPFLSQQSQQTLIRVHKNPSACLAIFRLLRPLERQIIFNLLWLEVPIPSSTIASWVTKEGIKYVFIVTLA